MAAKRHLTHHYLYLHGFCSGPHTFKGNQLRERFCEQGIELRTPDLNGDDFLHMTLTSQLEIVRTEVAGLDGGITLIGSSLGGYLAALLAQESEAIQRLLLIAPAFHFFQRFAQLLGEAPLKEWRDSGHMSLYHYGDQQEREINYALMRDAQRYDPHPLKREIPALLFHGIYDQSVPYSVSIDYLESNPKAELVLFNSEHTLHDQMESIWQHMGAWLQRYNHADAYRETTLRSAEA